VLAATLRDEQQHLRPRDLDWAGLGLLSPGLAMFIYSTDHIEDPAGLRMLIAAVIPVYPLRACGRSPSEMGWLMAPLGLGMMCSSPLMGASPRFRPPMPPSVNVICPWRPQRST